MLAAYEQTMLAVDGDLPSVLGTGGGGLYLAETPISTNNNMMLSVADTNTAIQAKPYNVEDMAVDNSELGAEAMPAQLIDQPLTVGKKWLIVGMLVVVVAIGLFIYKQSKKNNKRRF